MHLRSILRILTLAAFLLAAYLTFHLYLIFCLR